MSHEFPMRMEDSRKKMNKRIIAFAVLSLMLSVVLASAAGAETMDPATPTDMTCMHAHDKTTIYFFDSPVYASVSPDYHRVSGPALVEKVCTDCGEILSSETVDKAEEIRPHSMKKGVCVLCGYREAARTEEHQQKSVSGEKTIIVPEDGNVGGLLAMTLSETDLTALRDSGVSTVLVRGKNGSAAIILNVRDALKQMDTDELDLYLELAEQETGSFFAGLYLVSGSGSRVRPADGGITLRFYQKQKAGSRVSVAPADSDTLVETEGVWDERGFWSVPYMAEGTYFILQ